MIWHYFNTITQFLSGWQWGKKFPCLFHHFHFFLSAMLDCSRGASYNFVARAFVPPGWGVNSSQSRRSCSFSGNKQRCWTVLSELRYKVAYNLNTFFVNWKQRTAGKAVEDALQYIIMYVAGVWTKTVKGYFKNVEEQVIRRQSKVWSNLYCF